MRYYVALTTERDEALPTALNPDAVSVEMPGPADEVIVPWWLAVAVAERVTQLLNR